MSEASETVPCEYPSLEWVKGHVPTVQAAYGIAAPSHGSMVIGVIAGSSVMRAVRVYFKGQNVEFKFLDRPPGPDPDFGEPVQLT